MTLVSSLTAQDNEESQCRFCKSYYHDDKCCPNKPSELSTSPFELPCCYCGMPYHMGKFCTYYEMQRKLYDSLDFRHRELLIAIDTFGSSPDVEEELADTVIYMERVRKCMVDFKSRYGHALNLTNFLPMHDSMTPSHSLPSSSSSSIKCEINEKHNALHLSARNVNISFDEFDVPLIDDSLLISNPFIDNALTLARNIPLDSLDLLDSLPHTDHMFLNDVKHVDISFLQDLSCHLTLEFSEFDNNDVSIGLVVDDKESKVTFDFIATNDDSHFDSLIPSVAYCMPLVDFLGYEKYLLPIVPNPSLLTSHTPLCHMIHIAHFHGFKYFDSCGVLGVGSVVCLSSFLQESSSYRPQRYSSSSYILDPLPIEPEPPPTKYENNASCMLKKFQFLIRDENFSYKSIKRFRQQGCFFPRLIFLN